jgi:hypothetical protein
MILLRHPRAILREHLRRAQLCQIDDAEEISRRPRAFIRPISNGTERGRGARDVKSRVSRESIQLMAQLAGRARAATSSGLPLRGHS